MMTIVRERRIDGPANDVDPLMLVKGGPDVLFPYCTNVLSADGTVTSLDGASLGQLSRIQAEWSSQGQRVLALCMRTLQAIKVDPQHVNANDMEGLMYSELQNLTLVGLVGIQDPPRSNVEGAVRLIKRAGVRIFMVTGDFTLTAVAIARNVCGFCSCFSAKLMQIFVKVGIVTQEKVDGIDDLRASESAKRFRGAPPADIKPSEGDALRALVLTGDDVDHLAPEDWDALVGNYAEVVFARTTPEQKLKIVEEIKARGDNTVAVTGDGVNDAPALKASDIGVAMGSGSDVAKEAGTSILNSR
jgi:sodium/potassium-transporting ATPase subunit alpha